MCVFLYLCIYIYDMCGVRIYTVFIHGSCFISTTALFTVLCYNVGCVRTHGQATDVWPSFYLPKVGL